MNSDARQRVILIAAGALLIAGGVGLLSWTMFTRYRDLEFTIRFDDAKQLKPGQPIVYQGVRIGEVADVTLDGAQVSVAVSINSEYSSRVYQEAIFEIEAPSVISAERQVTVHDRSGSRTPILQGSIVQGTEGFFIDVLKKARTAVESLSN